MPIAAAVLMAALLAQWQGQQSRDIAVIPGAEGKMPGDDEDGDGEDDNLRPMRNGQLKQTQINLDKRKLRELVEKIRRGERLSQKDQATLPIQLRDLQDQVRLKAEGDIAHAADEGESETLRRMKEALKNKLQHEAKQAAEAQAAAAQRADAEAMTRAIERRQEEAAQAVAREAEMARAQRNQNLMIGGGLTLIIAIIIGGRSLLKRRG